MRTQSIRSWQLALMLMLGTTAVACGDSSSGGDDDAPDLTGNNSDGDNNGDGDNNTGADNGGDNGNTTANGGTNAGSNAPEDNCVKSPKTSADFLNQCAPAGVERRAFNNVERLPSTYKPGEELPKFP